MKELAGLEYVLRRLHHGEHELADQLLSVAERHRTEHEVHHTARDLAGWSQRHVSRIAAHAESHHVTLPSDPQPKGAAGEIVSKLATLLGRRPEPGLLLLDDLRHLYLMAADNSLSWEMLGQLAQATHQPDTLELVSTCHPQTLRQVRWANTMLKTLSPQTLTSL